MRVNSDVLAPEKFVAVAAFDKGGAGRDSRRRDYHSANPLSAFSRRFNSDGEGCQQNDSHADG